MRVFYSRAMISVAGLLLAAAAVAPVKERGAMQTFLTANPPAAGADGMPRGHVPGWRETWRLIAEDFAAHDRDPWRQGVWALVVYRLGRWRYGVRPALLRKPLHQAVVGVVAAVASCQRKCENFAGIGIDGGE